MITDTVEKSAEILKDFLVENTIPVLPIKEYSGCLKRFCCKVLNKE